jgi:shikimate dehydrogenase
VRRMELLGQGIQHSASPGMWNGIFASMSSDYIYGLRDVAADRLAGALDDLRSGRIAGYHVTMPYKNWAFEAADHREADVQRSGVSNCLTIEDGVVSGANTDVAAARILLQELPALPQRVLVLGAGATGTSLGLASSEVADEVFVANRSAERSQLMAERDWPRRVTVVDWKDREDCVADVDLVVNATSCGLTTSESPLRAWTAGPASALYDLVYQPQLTALQLQAAAAGAAIVDGLAHLQAHAEATIPRLGLPTPAAGSLREVMAEVAGRRPLRWDRVDVGESAGAQAHPSIV